MEFVIGAILLIIVLMITGLILRKRVYDAIDRHESWKMDIMNRNIASELARIKTLNLSGETQEKFDAWKERWEYIVTKELSDVEEYLFDAEEAADRYRFPRANKALLMIDKILQSVEEDIQTILNELDGLLESEKLSRKEIELLAPQVKELRQKLQTRRHHYGNAHTAFLKELDQYDKDIATYHQLVESGDYSKAQQLVANLKEELETFVATVEEFPEILKLCQDHLPSQLDELLSGIQDMKNEGYHIAQLGFEEDIRTYKLRLRNCVKSLEKGNVSEIKAVMTEIEERIQEMYDHLEQEALAKNYIESHFPNYKSTLQQLSATFLNTKAEVDQLRQTYYLEDSDMEKYLLLEKSMNQLQSQLEELSNNLSNKGMAHTELRGELENSFQQLEELKLRHENFTKQIHNLRKDELEAKEKLSIMREQLNGIQRHMKKSNIPGVPSFIWSMMEEATNRNDRVIDLLNKQPLEIAKVQHALTEAKTAVENVVEQTDVIIEQAYLTEQVIQYANRYRSQYPLLAAKLSESERLFRSYEYELALEQAAQAIEEIEPGALKRIEAYQNEKVST